MHLPHQVTVYNNSDLFQEKCQSVPADETCEERVITPITVIMTTDSYTGSQVEVTYEDVKVRLCITSYLCSPVSLSTGF